MARKVLVIGGGGREHALAWKLAQSCEVFVVPGNGGTTHNVPIAGDDFAGLIRFVQENQIDLTVVGPEAPLALGIVDAFQEKNLAIFGATRAAAQLESSKAFAKAFMREYDIPTADYGVFTDYESACDFLTDAPVVIKASGLAAGKGVLMCANRAEAEAALHQMFIEKAFGDAGQTVVIEEYLTGREISVLAFSDGKTILPMPVARDHKRIFDGDQGANTGGMGAFAPTPDISPEIIAEACRSVLQPAIDGMNQRGTPYMGVLYAGLMLTPQGMRTLEFNCRFGDPETQVILPLLKSDLYEVMQACIAGNLTQVEWASDQTCATVVLAAPGYPNEYPKGLPISGLDDLPNDMMVFHAGTKRTEQGIVTSGGRVLNVTALGRNLDEALKQVYSAIEQIYFEGMHFRHDIGRTIEV
jgi:phosphoribosylamine---glycine ligase